MNKNIHIDKSPIIPVPLEAHHFGIGEYMKKWGDLTSAEKTVIDREYDQFIQDIQDTEKNPTADAVNYVVKKPSDFKTILDTIKTEFEFPDKELEEKVKEFNRHAQRQINIYFRYGCELIYFFVNKEIQPMVKKEGEDNLVVHPGQGGIPLPEYFWKFKNGQASVPYNKKTQKDIFAHIMAHDFLVGKKQFLAKFSLKESEDSAILSEEIYFSYYIAWQLSLFKNPDNFAEAMQFLVQWTTKHTFLQKNPKMEFNDYEKLKSSSNPNEIGKAFLEFIFWKYPDPETMPKTYGFDLTEFALLGRKNYKQKKEVSPIYSQKLSKVAQRAAHLFPDFEKIKYPNGNILKGLLSRIRFEYVKLANEEDDSKTFERDDWKELKKYREEIEDILEDIVDAINCNTDYNPDNEKKTRLCLENLYESRDSKNAYNLPGILNDCCNLNSVRTAIIDSNEKKYYEDMKAFISEMWNEASIRKTKSINAPINKDDDGYTFEGVIQDNKPQVELSTTSERISDEGNHSLLLFFQAAFVGKNAFLKDIEKLLEDDPENFREQFYRYADLYDTDGNELKEIFKSQQGVLPKEVKGFDAKIRYEVLLPLLTENIFLYGPKLKEIFSSVFHAYDEEGFGNSVFGIFDIIDDTYSEFTKFMRSLRATQFQEEDNALRQEYQEVLFPDNHNLPPFVNEVNLRIEINNFFNKKGSFWKLRNAYLKLFPCFKNDPEWEDLLYNKYNKTTTSPIDIEIFNERFKKIAIKINKEELVRYGKINY